MDSTFKFPLVVNVLLQPSSLQIHDSDRSCVFMCCLTFPFCEKAFPHWGQT